MTVSPPGHEQYFEELVKTGDAQRPAGCRRYFQIESPLRHRATIGIKSHLIGSGVGIEQDVCFGSKADICSAKGHVRFTPNSDRKSRHAAMVMSALHPKADMCGANRHVRFGPIADIETELALTLFDQLVGADEHRRRNG